MATQPISMNIIKQVLIRLSQKESIRSIASALHISKNTVNRYKLIAEADSLSTRELIALEDTVLNHRFNGGSPAYCDERMEVLKELLPALEKELKKPHVTSQLLWEEYRRDHPDGYSLSQFRYHISQHMKAVTPSTLLRDLYQPGQKMLIDFAGDRLSYIDTDTGEEVFVETYVAIMPYSGMTFVMCVRSQGIEQFLMATVRALEFFGGVPKILVPDNLKSAVKKADSYEPDLTTGMNDLANHYLCVAQPARVHKPKDKALVEDAVNKAYRHIYAPLRNRIFHSLEELNEAVAELVDRYNQKRLTGCDYSRRECFLASEKPMLAPLPQAPFEFKRRATLKVAPNSFITFGANRNSYSVPYRLIGQQVDVHLHSHAGTRISLGRMRGHTHALIPPQRLHLCRGASSSKIKGIPRIQRRVLHIQSRTHQPRVQDNNRGHIRRRTARTGILPHCPGLLQSPTRQRPGPVPSGMYHSRQPRQSALQVRQGSHQDTVRGLP